MGWVVNVTLRPLYPRERASTQYIGGWVGPRTGLEEYGKPRPHRDLDPRTVQPVVIRYTDWAITISTYNRTAAKYLLKANSKFAVLNLCFSCKDAIWGMKLSTHLLVVPTLRISGATHLLFPHAFMPRTGKILKHNKSVLMLNVHQY
jgi:hypothetical protein